MARSQTTCIAAASSGVGTNGLSADEAAATIGCTSTATGGADGGVIAGACQTCVRGGGAGAGGLLRAVNVGCAGSSGSVAERAVVLGSGMVIGTNWPRGGGA